MPESYQTMRGEKNPMRRPEVAAKQSSALRKTWADPERRKQMLAHKNRINEIRRQVGQYVPEPKPDRKWSPERKQAHSERMKAYWAKIHAALAVMGESKHDD